MEKPAYFQSVVPVKPVQYSNKMRNMSIWTCSQNAAVSLSGRDVDRVPSVFRNMSNS